MAEISYCDTRRNDEWEPHFRTHHLCAEIPQEEIDDWLTDLEAQWFPQTTTIESVQERFERYANEWQRDTAHVSSVSDLASHHRYRNIIELGWEVVPFLLADLRINHRFWFPALDAITGIRPFDRRDAGNSQAMTKAWLDWGKRKGLID